MPTYKVLATWLAATALTSLLAACASIRTTGVSFGFDAQLDPPPQSATELAGQIEERPDGRKAVRTNLFTWEMSLGADSLGGSIGARLINHSEHPVCLDFSAATLTGPSGVPRRLQVRRYFHAENHTVLPLQKSDKATDVKDVVICFKPHTPNRVSAFYVAPALEGVFANDTMFNVLWDDAKQTVTDAQGQSFTLSLPITHHGERMSLSVRFVANSARWISSYH
jgi:hypothetical protein